MRNRFIIGAAGSYPVGGTGGVSQHLHSFTSSPHSHDLDYVPGITAGVEFSEFPVEATDSGLTGLTNVLPAYYALCYIQFLGV